MQRFVGFAVSGSMFFLAAVFVVAMFVSFF